MKNPVMKVYRAYDEMFVNSKSLVIEYHDVLRAQWFATLQCLVKTDAVDDFFDLSYLKTMDGNELYEWYVMREHQNFLLDLPCKTPFESMEEKEKVLDQFLFNIGEIPQLYARNVTLNFHDIFLNLLRDGKGMVKHIYIYGGKIKDPLLEAQVKQEYTNDVDFLYGDFGKSLHEVVDTYHPDRILIEPSGVGKLSDVIKAVQDVQGEIDAELNSFTTVVDVTKCKIYRKNFGEFFSNQIEYAGAVILSRTDKAKPEKIQESVALLRELNEKAPIITTPIEQLPGEKILETMESSKSLEDELLAEVAKEAHDHEHHHHHDHEECDHEHHHHDHEEHEHHHHDGECSCGCGHHHHHDHEGHHHADEVFTSWGKETIHTYTKDEVSAILKTLEEDGSYGNVLRAKGMVAGADGEWIYFDMVPEEHEVRTGAPEYTGRICVIGAELNEDKLAELFKLK